MIYCNFQKTYTTSKRSFYINIKTTFKENAINVLFGPSGSGKTSILRLLSGLDKIDKGIVKVDQQYWDNTNENKRLHPSKRNIAYVTQDYGLFPNMTVLENLQFAQNNINKNLLDDLITTLEIDQLLNTKPEDLSGGQQQRVALARALTQEPEILLLDEPLTAIEENLRDKLHHYLISLQRKYKLTILLVSHNLQEVLKVADYVYIVNSGRITAQGTTTILLDKNPQNTLTGNVLSIHSEFVTVLIGTQQINIVKHQISTTSYSIGSTVKILMN